MIAVILCGLGSIQLGSDALYGAAVSPNALPARVPESFGLAVYHWLDRVAPAPYVEASLARTALAHGDAATAEHYALRLPPTPARNELLARAAQARGDHVLAVEYYIAAPDVDAVQAEVERMALRDPLAAYAFEERFRNHLIELTTHPDAVADSYWISGGIAVRAGRNERALADFERAAQQAPLNAKYALASANQALTMNRLSDAQRWYATGLSINPQHADATAGMGIVALRTGDRTSALRYARRARAIDANSQLLAELERELR